MKSKRNLIHALSLCTFQAIDHDGALVTGGGGGYADAPIHNTEPHSGFGVQSDYQTNFNSGYGGPTGGGGGGGGGANGGGSGYAAPTGGGGYGAPSAGGYSSPSAGGYSAPLTGPGPAPPVLDSALAAPAAGGGGGGYSAPTGPAGGTAGGGYSAPASFPGYFSPANYRSADIGNYELTASPDPSFAPAATGNRYAGRIASGHKKYQIK